jgi:hypothetical protein
MLRIERGVITQYSRYEHATKGAIDDLSIKRSLVNERLDGLFYWKSKC